MEELDKLEIELINIMLVIRSSDIIWELVVEMVSIQMKHWRGLVRLQKERIIRTITVYNGETIIKDSRA